MTTLLLLLIAALAATDGGPPAPAAGADPSTPDPALLVGAPLLPPLAGAALDARTDEVASLIRCPVCQGSSVADSPSESARNMKRQVAEMLSRGFSEDQILMYFELSYGEFIRLRPKAEGMNLVVWAAPAFAILAGLAVLIAALRRLGARSTASGGEGSGGPRPPPEDPELAPYLDAVRRLTDGEGPR